MQKKWLQSGAAALATARVLACAGLGLLMAGAHAGEVEVLHYWTSGGEARSLEELKKIMRAQGHTWRDFAVTGGGGDNASTVLRQRVADGHPPTAANIKAAAIAQWAAQGALTDLDLTAQAQKWDSLLPRAVAQRMKYRGHYVAVPVNVHRVNWMWANAQVLKKAGVTELPTTWSAWFAAADKVQKAGGIALAHGGQDWQDFTTFESVALGVGGAAFYQAALVERDAKALRSATMVEVLQTLRKLKGYTDAQALGRDWHIATAMVIEEKAAFQFMADWAKGEFSAAGKLPGKDYRCAPMPGTAQAYTFSVDAFAMFKLPSTPARKAQADLAAALMGSAFQEVFSRNKGSIPVRLYMDMGKFDACAQTSAHDFASAGAAGTLLPSVAHGMALQPAVQTALKDAVSAFWQDDSMPVAQAVQRIAAAAQTRQKSTKTRLPLP